MPRVILPISSFHCLRTTQTDSPRLGNWHLCISDEAVKNLAYVTVHSSPSPGVFWRDFCLGHWAFPGPLELPLRAAVSSSVTESACDHDLPPWYLKHCQTACVQIPVNCVALGKSLHLAKPQPPPLKAGDDNKAPASEVCCGD